MASKANEASASPASTQDSGGFKPNYSAPSGAASTPGEDVSRRAAEVADTAKQVASEAGERLNITMEDQKRAGAQRIAQFAQAVQTAASQLDRDSPEFARYIRGAAEQVQGLSEKLRNQNVGELFNEFQSFAKRNPTAFLGATVLTGFALARFIKSATDTQGSTSGTSRGSSQHTAQGSTASGQVKSNQRT